MDLASLSNSDVNIPYTYMKIYNITVERLIMVVLWLGVFKPIAFKRVSKRCSFERASNRVRAHVGDGSSRRHIRDLPPGGCSWPSYTFTMTSSKIKGILRVYIHSL